MGVVIIMRPRPSVSLSIFLLLMTLHQSSGAPDPVGGNMGILYLQEIGEDALRNGNPYEVEQTATEQKRMLKDQEKKGVEIVESTHRKLAVDAKYYGQFWALGQQTFNTKAVGKALYDFRWQLGLVRKRMTQ